MTTLKPSGKVAIVRGTGRGIGRAFALSLALRGVGDRALRSSHGMTKARHGA
jgi:NAD(P)-dependent dehydrogenase (short-subunit alcohol dehydrogenase family)